jgi:hypothetical protein
MKPIFRVAFYVYFNYFIEFLILTVLNLILFKLEYPNGKLTTIIGRTIGDLFLWTIWLRTIFGYSLIQIFFVWLGFPYKIKIVNTLYLSLVGLTIYALISLMYAFWIIPDTKDYLIFDLSYRGTFFYYSLVCLILTPLISRVLKTEKLLLTNELF